MGKQYNIPGYGTFVRADQMGIPASAGKVTPPAASLLQEAYFDGGDPMQSRLARSVHGFMDANPQLGAGGAENLPTRASQRIFQSLMSKYYGNPDFAAMNEDPEFARFLDQNADGYAPLYEGSALATDFMDAMGEPQANQEAMMLANEEFDAGQPYGQDFSYDAAEASPMEGFGAQAASLLPMAVSMGGMAMGHPIAGIAGSTALSRLLPYLLKAGGR